MLKILGVIGSVIVALVMTAVMIGAVYENRGALPVVGAVFGVLIVFGLLW